MPFAVLYPTSDIVANWPSIYPTDPSTHYDKVDDSYGLPDDDSTYIETDDTQTPYADRYGKGTLSLPAGATITSVQVLMRARRVPLNPSFPSNPRIYGGLRISGNSYFGDTTRTISNDSYDYFLDTWENNPATGNPWTLDDINNTLEGFSVLGNSGRTYDPGIGIYWYTLVRATQVLLIVNYEVAVPVARRFLGDGLTLIVS